MKKYTHSAHKRNSPRIRLIEISHIYTYSARDRQLKDTIDTRLSLSLVRTAIFIVHRSNSIWHRDSVRDNTRRFRRKNNLQRVYIARVRKQASYIYSRDVYTKSICVYKRKVYIGGEREKKGRASKVHSIISSASYFA